MLLRRTRLGVAGCLGAGAVLLTAACGGSTVEGVPEAARTSVPSTGSTTAPSTPSTPSTPSSDSVTPTSPAAASALAALTLDPSVFPSTYQAVVLPPQAVAQAAQDLDGVAAGASVDPAGCKPDRPTADPDATSLVVGTDPVNRATVSVELARVSDTLESLRSRTEECGTVRTTAGGVTAEVVSELVPPPPLGADDTLAVRRTVSSGGGADEITQSMLSLVGQIDDVRVTATYMSFGAGEPDTATLDLVFREAVQKVKNG
ncbi:sensor domain-containing protein [Rhodococcoides corynebacterioides]|uniref:sensor domain-containing protein n=1 Tax=Rhodococcoides corynebacterioides TaxID=53972 RepID=UPI0021C22A70|nr:sensor domain-containing protein [Rhodococcus corynebacterioides]